MGKPPFDDKKPSDIDVKKVSKTPVGSLRPRAITPWCYISIFIFIRIIMS
jgi:hypothetical protein